MRIRTTLCPMEAEELGPDSQTEPAVSILDYVDGTDGSQAARSESTRQYPLPSQAKVSSPDSQPNPRKNLSNPPTKDLLDYARTMPGPKGSSIYTQGVPRDGGGDRMMAVETDAAVVPTQTPGKPDTGVSEGWTSPLSVNTQETFDVLCPCGYNADDGLMVLCSVCNKWQHAVCFRILNQDQAPEEHICDVCCQDKKTVPTDCQLVGLTPIVIQAKCLWRRALMCISEFSKVETAQLADSLGVGAEIAAGVMQRLVKEGYIEPKGHRGVYLVDVAKIKGHGIDEYFKDTSEAVEAEIDSLAKQVERVKVKGPRKRTLSPLKNAEGVQVCSDSQCSGPLTRGAKRKKASRVKEPIRI